MALPSFTDLFAQVFRYFSVDGVPASGAHKPSKSEIKALGQSLDFAIAAAAIGGDPEAAAEFLQPYVDEAEAAAEQAETAKNAILPLLTRVFVSDDEDLIVFIDGSDEQIVLGRFTAGGVFQPSKWPTEIDNLIVRISSDVTDGSGDLLQILDNSEDGVYLLRITSAGLVKGKFDGLDPAAVALALSNSATALAAANTALATVTGSTRRQLMRDLAARARNNNQFVLGAMASPPTITCAAGSTIPAGLTKAYTASAANTGRFNSFGGDVIDSGGGFWKVKAVSYPSGQGNLGSGANALSWAHEWKTDAPKMTIPYAADPTTCFFRVLVDGQYATKVYTQVNPAGGASTITIDFGTRAPEGRHVVLESIGNSQFGGVYVDPLSSVWAPSRGDIIRIVWNSDSIFEGEAGKPHPTPCASWAHVASAALGMRNCIQSAIGGSGYLNPGTRWKFQDHIADVTGRAPDFVCLTGSVNDLPNTYNVTDFGNAVNAYYIAARAALPGVPFALIGLCPGGSIGGTLASIDAYEAKLAALAASWGDPNLRFFPLSTANPAGAYFTGNGTSVSPNGSGNSDLYIGGGPHTNEPGDLYGGLRLGGELRNWISTF